MKKEILVKGNKIIVSDDGKIFSTDGKEKSQFENSAGYMYVALYNKKHERSNLLVHRLVAKAFLDNPKGFPYVNHKDLNTKNNYLSNLEYCSARYNNLYADKVKRQTKTMADRGRTVKTNVYKDGKLIKKCLSINSACRYTGVTISRIFTGLKENHGEFKFNGYTYVALNNAYKGKATSGYVYTKKNTAKPKKKFYCKECGKEIYYGSTYCKEHYTLGRKPKYKNRKLGKNEIKESLTRNKGNFTKSAKEFLMTDNALRKWCRKYGLSSHSCNWK